MATRYLSRVVKRYAFALLFVVLANGFIGRHVLHNKVVTPRSVPMTSMSEVGFVTVGTLKKGGHHNTPLAAIATTSHPAAQSFPSGRFVMNYTEETSEPPLIRAVEIALVLQSHVVKPILSSLLKDGLPSNWEEFWASGDNGDRVALAVEQLGPTYVKFGQALASRPDVVPKSLASALSVLQDNMQPFPTADAKVIIREQLLEHAGMNVTEVETLLGTLSEEPVAAASLAQVYRAELPGYGTIAIKVQRPGLVELVKRDAMLLRTLASWAESIPMIPGIVPETKEGQDRLIATELVSAVEEFMSRILEELDYRNEVANVARFADHYCHRTGKREEFGVVVPEIITNMCTDHIVVMEWLDGCKLTEFDEKDDTCRAENMDLMTSAIECTLSQLLETGVLHADPHAGNLWRVDFDETAKLGYLDFGLVSAIPPQVRDGLVCSVVQLVFAQDVEAVANLFGELQLLPKEVMEEPTERAALRVALEETMASSLEYPETVDEDETPIPKLKFDKLLDALSRLVPRFQFQLPPYFVNNARALSTLEGIARTLDPSFNVLQIMYPYALTRLLTNPSGSPVVEKTLQSLVRDPESGRVSMTKLSKLLKDSALITGFSRRRVLTDVLRTKEGRRFVWRIAREQTGYRLKSIAARRRRRRRGQHQAPNDSKV